MLSRQKQRRIEGAEVWCRGAGMQAVKSVRSLVATVCAFPVLEDAQLETLPRLAARFTDLRGLVAEILKRRWLTPFQLKKMVLGRAEELVLGSYVLLDSLGEGVMGQVFKARNWKLGRVVALKLIRKQMLSNPLAMGRFRREMELTAHLDHPNII